MNQKIINNLKKPRKFVRGFFDEKKEWCEHSMVHYDQIHAYFFRNLYNFTVFSFSLYAKKKIYD